MKRSWILFFLIIFVLSICEYVYPGERGIKWWKNPQIVSELNLNADQVNSIENIFSSNKGNILSLNSQLMEKERELRKLIRNPNATQQEVLNLTDQVENIKGELRRLEVKMFLEIREVLTPDQREKLHKIKERYRR